MTSRVSLLYPIFFIWLPCAALLLGACGDETSSDSPVADAGVDDAAAKDASEDAANDSAPGDGTAGDASDGTVDGGADTDGSPPPDAEPPVGVNFSTFGAVGDGIADDTAALQQALDSEGELIADPGAVFLISATLDIDQSFVHSVDWNGATVITSTSLRPMIRVNKRESDGGLTTMRDLVVNGNRVATHGVWIESRVNFVNVDALGFRQPTSVSPAGFLLNFYDDNDAYGTWYFDGCDVSDIIGASNGATGDSRGAANGYLIYWKEIPSSTITLDVRNATVRDCWGEDAQNVALFSPGIDISSTDSGTQWTNMTFLDWERRSIKGFAANNTFTDCSFTDPNPNDPDLYSSNKSGMVVVGTGSGATGADNQIFEGCVFQRAGYDGRVIVLDATNVQFRNCTWSGGADLLFTSFGKGGIGAVDICAGTFGADSMISDYGSVTYTGNDVISLDTDNTYVETTYITVSEDYYQEIDLTCAP